MGNRGYILRQSAGARTAIPVTRNGIGSVAAYYIITFCFISYRVIVVVGGGQWLRGNLVGFKMD